MSAVLEQPTEATAPVTGLLRSEVRRFRSRRFIQVLLGLSVLGWLAAVPIGLLNFGVPDASDFAAARAEIDSIVAEQQVFYEQCSEDPARPDDVPVDMYCGPPLRATPPGCWWCVRRTVWRTASSATCPTCCSRATPWSSSTPG